MAKAALISKTAAPKPVCACGRPDAHLALRDVSHTYPARAGQGPVPALGPLDFEFRRGEFVAVVGPSGRGKSTLLEIIAWFNVWDNVAFGLHRDGTDGAEITRRVDQALAFMLLRDESKKALGVA